MSKTHVTLAILNFNRAEFIERAVRSCQNQFRQYQNQQIIVIDDASTDSSQQIIGQFSDSVDVFINSKNEGAGYSSQRALVQSLGDYFIRVDSDDYISQPLTALFSHCLLENPEVDFVYGNLQVVNEFGKKLEVIDMGIEDNLIDYGAGIMFRRRVLMEVGGYDSKLRHGEDIDLMLRLKKAKKVGMHLPVLFYRYYKHSSNKSNSEDHHRMKMKLRENYGF